MLASLLVLLPGAALPSRAAQQLVVRFDGLELPIDLQELEAWSRNPRTRRGSLAPWLQRQLGDAIGELGLPLRVLPSGAGHDAMAIAALTEVAMLFVRCGNGGISHHPDESMTADDADTAADVFTRFVERFTPCA